MRRLKIVPGGERGPNSPAGGPALRANRDRPGSVIRRSGRRPARFSRFVGAVDWPFVWFTLGWAVAVFLTVYVAMGRMR